MLKIELTHFDDHTLKLCTHKPELELGAIKQIDHLW